MSLIGGSLPIGATFAPTGGSATTLLDLGGTESRRKLLINDGADYALRRLINVSYVEPQVNSGYPGGYTPIKRRIAMTAPITLSDSSVFVNQAIIELILHRETTDAQVDALRSDICNVTNDADFDGFFEDSSLS
jgi:hypothetical protein